MLEWALKWGKYLLVGLLHDAEWVCGLGVPYGEGFDYRRWCVVQDWERMIRWHCAIVGIHWRECDGGAMIGIRRVFALWRWAAAEEKRQIRLARRLSGLDIKSGKTATAFLLFWAQQMAAAKRGSNERDK